jgi:hypothetical protein
VVNVVILQGAAVPGTGSVFHLQIEGGGFSGTVGEGCVEVRMSGDVAEYVRTVIQSGLLFVVKGRYVTAGKYIEAESVSALRDKLDVGDSLWD